MAENQIQRKPHIICTLDIGASVAITTLRFIKQEEPYEGRLSSTVPWEDEGEIPLSDPIVRHFKTTMRSILIIGTFIILTSCNLTDRKNTQLTTKDSETSQIDTTLTQNSSSENSSFSDAYDSLARAHVDTSTLQVKRIWLMNQFLIENDLSLPDYDTLFDLTYDGFQDYVIGYYGKSGTGIKNRVKVYIFNPKKQLYFLDEQLSDLPNPTFYIKQKKITGFYIGNGGGGGRRLDWLNNKWITTKEFEVDKEGDTSKWKIIYPLKKKKEVVIRPFQMIPPDEILETQINW